MTLEEIRREARQLRDNERGTLIADLLATFAPPLYDVTDEEVAARVAETDSGEIEDISYEALKAVVARHLRQ